MASLAQGKKIKAKKPAKRETVAEAHLLEKLEQSVEAAKKSKEKEAKRHAA